MACAMAQAVRKAYRQGQNDETMEPLVLCAGHRPRGRIKAGDGVIFYNIRGEREIELTRSLTEAGFDKFATAPLSLRFATMIEYERRLPVAVAFPPDGSIDETLCDVLAAHDLRQAKITEAEKAVHVGFFLNGKKEGLLPGEDRIVVPTRKDVALFDEAPEMSIDAITAATLRAIADPGYTLVVTNLPNVDVVGHIENEEAILRAVAAVDAAAGTVLAAARRAGVTAVVTADHGTVERWRYPDGAIDTGHTASPVPFAIVASGGERVVLRSGGELTDIAPTVLELLGIPRPDVMTGRSLLASSPPRPAPRVLLLILDGWGENGDAYGNLIVRAHTPVFDALKTTAPFALLAAAGEAVGLPAGTVGNSEAGHLHIGAGRRVYADRVRIDQAIADGSFFHNPAFLAVMDAVRRRGAALHLMGIVSFFSSHGSLDHLFALMDLARRQGITELSIHGMLGRRGEQPESGANYVERIAAHALAIGTGEIVSVIGRYWSMDREENWDRIEKTYRMLVWGEGTCVAA
jgi:2,3-bisphosphoglycerate-independent phosphoglycerate mutase